MLKIRYEHSKQQTTEPVTTEVAMEVITEVENLISVLSGELSIRVMMTQIKE